RHIRPPRFGRLNRWGTAQPVPREKGANFAVVRRISPRRCGTRVTRLDSQCLHTQSAMAHPERDCSARSRTRADSSRWPETIFEVLAYEGISPFDPSDRLVSASVGSSFPLVRPTEGLT